MLDTTGSILYKTVAFISKLPGIFLPLGKLKLVIFLSFGKLNLVIFGHFFREIEACHFLTFWGIEASHFLSVGKSKKSIVLS